MNYFTLLVSKFWNVFTRQSLWVAFCLLVCLKKKFWFSGSFSCIQRVCCLRSQKVGIMLQERSNSLADKCRESTSAVQMMQYWLRNWSVRFHYYDEAAPNSKNCPESYALIKFHLSLYMIWWSLFFSIKHILYLTIQHKNCCKKNVAIIKMH